MDKSFLEKVKLLRNRTKISILECKTALEYAAGDISKAIYKLRENGALKIIDKSLRDTHEGLVIILINDNKSSGVILEVNCETDFVANNKEFIAYASDLASYSLLNKISSFDKSLFFGFKGGELLYSRLKDLLSKYGEHINIGRLKYLTTNKGCVYGYVHGKFNYGKFGSLMVANGINCDSAYDVSMHISALDPKYLTIDTIPDDVIYEERNLLLNETRKNFKDKSLDVINNIVNGKINKYYEQVVLYEQVFIKSDKDKMKVKIFIRDKFDVIEFIRFGVGENV